VSLLVPPWLASTLFLWFAAHDKRSELNLTHTRLRSKATTAMLPERCSVLAVLLLAQVLHLSEAYLHSGTVRRPSSAVVRQRQQQRRSLAAARGGLSRTDESWDKVEDEVDEVAQAAVTAQQPVVRRGPAIRRQLSISDLQGGFTGFKDELEATRLAKVQWDIDNPVRTLHTSSACLA
jgi:hypothetical protein